VNHTERATLDPVLWRAREAAFPPGQFVGQESFVTADEVLSLAARAGVAPGVRVLDLCCGVAGPGLHVTAELGCTYVGVDADPHAVLRGRRRAAERALAARVEVGRVPPLPPGEFDVVLLLETMLAFRDKADLVAQVAAALPVGGRFAFTVEEGAPLTASERAAMPASDTVWPVALPQLVSDLDAAGMQVTSVSACTASHLATVDGLLGAYRAFAPAISAVAGEEFADDLLRSHALWRTWLRTRRIRKFAVVAEKVAW